MSDFGTDFDSDDYRSDSTIEAAPRRVEPTQSTTTLPRAIHDHGPTRIHRCTSSSNSININTAMNTASNSGPSSKRQRTSTINQSHAPPALSTLKSIEQIDLSQDSDPDNAALSSTLAKQRSDAITSQASKNTDAAGKSKLNSLQCTVCLDTPNDLTATSCGHTFCYTCLMDWLVAADRDGGGAGRRSNCPACRKPISRTKKGDVVPLQIKVMRRKAK